MKKILKQTIFCTIFLSGFLMWGNAYGACTGSSPTWTTTPDYDSVSSCVNQASAGDTINVGAGTETWTDNLTITKAVNIIGAGIGNTIINNAYAPSLTGGTMDENKHLIAIVPETPAENPVIRISGMTLNIGATSYGIFYYNTAYNPIHDCTNVRIDHMSILASGAAYAFQMYGMAHGVMDNCTITGRMGISGDYRLWTTSGYTHGTNSAFYFEDNTWTPDGPDENLEAMAGNGAARTSFRYNTITLPVDHHILPLFDQHGNQYNSQASCFGTEMYGNHIITTGNTFGTMLYNQRGGKSLVFNNSMTWASGGGVTSTYIKEEHLDSDGLGDAVNGINGQPQHISDTYYFNNILQSGAELVPTLQDLLGIDIPVENTHVWFKKASFDGSVGMGCGILENRPATCTTGVGYWATDQSCTDMTDMVGANPATPISGTLYKCTATDTWTEYYTPYTYPHPLRTEAYDTVAPASPTGLAVS